MWWHQPWESLGWYADPDGWEAQEIVSKARGNAQGQAARAKYTWGADIVRERQMPCYQGCEASNASNIHIHVYPYVYQQVYMMGEEADALLSGVWGTFRCESRFGRDWGSSALGLGGGHAPCTKTTRELKNILHLVHMTTTTLGGGHAPCTKTLPQPMLFKNILPSGTIMITSHITLFPPRSPYIGLSDVKSDSRATYLAD